MEFGFLTILLSSALLGHSSGFTTYYSTWSPESPDYSTWSPETRPGIVGSCRAHFTASEGEFASPNFPNRYPHYAQCTWTIQSQQQKFITLRFPYVDIEPSSDCRYDSVRVYDGPSTSSPLLGSLCGSQKKSFHSRGSVVTVVFTSDNSVDGGGFIAQWVFTDNPDISETTTPEIPETTMADIATDWVTTAEIFETTTPDSVTASTDFMTVTTEISETTTGDIATDWVTTAETTTYLDSTTETTPYLDSTTAHYSCLYNCGYNLGACSCTSSCQYYGNCCHDYYDYCYSTTTTTETPTTTENTPSVDYITCRDRCGLDGGICSCTSSCLPYGYCCEDYVYYCTNTTVQPPTETTTDWVITTETTTYLDSTTETTPYLDSTTAHYSCLYNCGYNLGACSCTSSCQYYGNCCHDYYDYCYSTTTTTEETTIYTTTERTTETPTTETPTTTETTPSVDYITCRDRCGLDGGICSCTSSCLPYGYCCEDYVYYCTNTTVQPPTETTTDWVITTGGAPCGGYLTQPQGEFFSPNYPNGYPNNANCTWTLQAGELKVVLLNFTFVNLEPCCDFIWVYDGPSAQYPLMGNVTGQKVRPSFKSSRRYMTVVFTTDHSGNRQGFRAEWAFQPTLTCNGRCGTNNSLCSCDRSCQRYGNCCPDYYDYCYYTTTAPVTGGAPCGGNLTQPRGEFFSPNYPNYYPNYANCAWTLQAGELEMVLLNFTFVNLEPCCDFIRVYDGPSAQYQLMGNVTGQNQRPSFKSSSRYMTVVFTTDHSVTRQGFRAEWAFQPILTCNGRCGTSNSLCSCDRSCQRYGNCCQDYYDYCYYTTTAPVAACGGSLQGSGFISSPYYPNYYHDNAYCVWHLSAPAGQTVFLSFQDLDLERCCSCDYVNVYDGSSTGSRLMGQLCHANTSQLEFQSSSSYMTVLFRSDYSGVGRGFKAYFSSTLNQNTGHVDCSSGSMNIIIRKSYLDSLGFSWHDLYLDDHRCRASADYYYVKFHFPLNSCSTSIKSQNGRVTYTNNVRAAQSTSGEITRYESSFLWAVSCVMERESSVGTLYEVEETSNVTISGTGRFNTSMAFFPSSNFYYPITEFPYQVDLNQQLYIQVQLTQAQPSIHLFIDTCVASPNHDFSIRTYDLIRNGCRRDSTVVIYRNGDRYFAQFSFRAFMFLRTHNRVFLRCHAIICTDNDYNSRCRQGCRNRRKRSLSSDDHIEVVTLGPITLKGAE